MSSYSWNGYFILSAVIFFLLVQNKLDGFDEDTDRLQLVWADVLDQPPDTEAVLDDQVTLSPVLRKKLSSLLPSQTEHVLKRAPQIIGLNATSSYDAFLAVMSQQYVLTIVQRSIKAGPKHNAWRGSIARYTRSMHLSLPVHAQTDDWELVWKKDLPGQVIRTAENSQTRDIAVAYNVMSRHSTTTKVLGIASHHATATEPKTLYELELPGTLGFTSFSIRPHDGALMFAHPNGFHKFHIAKPQGASWSWGGRTADSSCGDDVCVIDGPMADRRPQVSCTVNLLWMDGTDTTQSGVLTLELLLRSRSKASTGSLLLEVHSSNESRVSRCSCNEPDLLHTKHRYKLDASFTANLPAADYLFPRTAYAHSKEHGFSVISIVDLVFMVNHTDALNVTQVLPREQHGAVKLIQLSPDGNTMVMIMEDNSIFVLWHAPGEPLRAPEVLDSVTALAYDAMMLEPEAYSKIGGDYWNHYAVIAPPEHHELAKALCTAIVPSDDGGLPYVAVVRDGGLLSVYRTVQATESVDEDEFQVDVYTTMTSIVLVCVGLVVCVTTWNSDFTPQREAEPVAQPH